MTNKLELGKMSYEELYGLFRELYTNKPNPTPEEKARRLAVADETEERSKCHDDGAPGRAPLLSVAQVVATLGPLLESVQCDEQGALAGYHQGRWNGIEDCARALLALPPDAPSPL